MPKPNPYERPDPDRVPSHVVSHLPETAYAVNRESGELVIIKRGVRGYYPYLEPDPRNATTCATLNERMGVTPAQAAAMEWGSLFGWHTPGAEPANYNDDGTLRRRPA